MDRLTLTDQIFINACAALVLGNGPENEPLLIETAREARAGVNEAHPHVGRVARAWDQFEVDLPIYQRPQTYGLGRALAPFFMWRAGLAQDALRARKGEAA